MKTAHKRVFTGIYDGDPAREFIAALLMDELEELAKGTYPDGRKNQIESWFQHKPELVDLVHDGLGLTETAQRRVMTSIAQGLAEDGRLSALYNKTITTQINTPEAKAMMKKLGKTRKAKKPEDSDDD